jgi:hypothetical protein
MVRQGCFVFLALYCAVTGAAAQYVPPKLMESCGGGSGLCGFKDRETGAEVIPRRFEVVGRFAEGRAAVGIKGRYGFIDETGAVVVVPRFDMVGEFYQGLAEVLVGDKTGVIDRDGNIVVTPQFARAIPFTKDVILVKDGNWQPDGPYRQRWLLTVQWLNHFWQGPFGLYSISAGWLARPQFHVHGFEAEGRGLIWATAQDLNKKPMRIGLLRADGTWQVEPQYSSVQRLMDERAIVSIPQNGSQSPAQLDGAVDPDGRLTVPFRPWRLSPWANGLGLVREGGKAVPIDKPGGMPVMEGVKVGLIDKAGRIIGGRLFDDVRPASTGDVSKVLLDGNWVGLDRGGRIVANPDDGVIVQCPTGVKLVRQSGQVQVLGPDGQPAVPFLLDDLLSRPDCSQPLWVKSGSRVGFIGADGRFLGDPPFFEQAAPFAAGYSAVMRDGKWGIIDTAGRFTVDPQYDGIGLVGEGVYVAMKDGRKSWITAAGVDQPEPVPDRSDYQKCGPDGGTFISRPDSSAVMMWGIADPAGREIIKPIHRAIHCFKNGLAWVPDDARRQWCPIDPDGVIGEGSACTPLRYPYFQTHAYPDHFSDDQYENSVLWTRAFLEFGAGLRAMPPRWNLAPGAMSTTTLR